MPLLKIDSAGSFDVPEGQRLAVAIEACGIDIGHRCGGKARCTTCRIRFLEGEPDVMTQAEYDKLVDRGLLGEVRLACQIVADRPMAVEVLMHVDEMGWDDPGPDLAPVVQPEATWYALEDLDRSDAA